MIPKENCFPVFEDIENESSSRISRPSPDHCKTRPLVADACELRTITEMLVYSRPSSHCPVKVALEARVTSVEFEDDMMEGNTQEPDCEAWTVGAFVSSTGREESRSAPQVNVKKQTQGAIKPPRILSGVRINLFRLCLAAND